jgi:hypothetical protein
MDDDTKETVMTCCPSSLKYADLTPSTCCIGSPTSRPVSTSHTCTDL